jgi:succinate-acetate transporter protein
MTASVVPMSSTQEGNRLMARASQSAITLPSILGMYTFAAATFIVAAHMAHWYGNVQSAMVLFPLVLIFGGLTQFYAGAWAFRTNDAGAMVFHCTWGAFWTAYGILELLFSSGRVARPVGAFPELGFWFIVVAAITWSIAAASRENKVITTVVTLLAIGSTLEAIAELAGLNWMRILSAYFLIVSALIAWYAASALLMRTRKAITGTTAAPTPQTESTRAA